MQILLNLSYPKNDVSASQRNQRLALRRAALKWLLDSNPEHLPAVGVDVPTRGNTLRADIAASWLTSQKTHLPDGSAALVSVPLRTSAVICCTSRQECWPECSDADRLLSEIASLTSALHERESTIRQNEPQLRDSNVLFEEYAVWNYAASQDAEYHKLTKQLASLKSTLFRGSRLARLCNNLAADTIYLATPPGILSQDEGAGPWGLLEIDTKSLQTTLLREATDLNSPADIRASLSCHIAEASTRQVLDWHGLKLEGQTVIPVRLPTFRRTPLK